MVPARRKLTVGRFAEAISGADRPSAAAQIDVTFDQVSAALRDNNLAVVAALGTVRANALSAHGRTTTVAQIAPCGDDQQEFRFG